MSASVPSARRVLDSFMRHLASGCAPGAQGSVLERRVGSGHLVAGTLAWRTAQEVCSVVCAGCPYSLVLCQGS